MSSLDISFGLESIIDSPFRTGELNLPEKKDFVPKGDRVPSFVDVYFRQDNILNDNLIELAKPNLAFPHLMTSTHFKQVLRIMVRLLREKAKNSKTRSNRILKAASTLDELDENMDLLMFYLASLYKA